MSISPKTARASFTGATGRTCCLLALAVGILLPAVAIGEEKSFDHLRYTWKWPADFDPNGKIVIRWSAEPETLNMVASKDSYASVIRDYCYVSLLDRHPDTTALTPDLAKYWEMWQKSTLFFADKGEATKAAALLKVPATAGKIGLTEVMQDGDGVRVRLATPGTSWEELALAVLGNIKPLKVTYVSFWVDKDAKFADGKLATSQEVRQRAEAELSKKGVAAKIRIEWPSTFSPVIWVVTGDGAAVRNTLKALLKSDAKDGALGQVQENQEFGAVNQPVIRMFLRKGVKWTDGTPTTAHDVKFGYDLTTNRKVDATRSANYYHSVLSFETPNDYEILVTYKKPYFKALEVLGWIPIVPKQYSFGMDVNSDAFAKKFNTFRHLPQDEDGNTVCNGAYILKKWDENYNIVLERNENYWAQKPGIKTIIIRFIKEETPAMVELKNGKIDSMSLTSEQWKNDTSDEGFKKRFHKVLCMPPNTGYRYIGWNMTSDLFKDRRVRLAMTHAFDRRSLIRDYEYGLAIIRTGLFFPYGAQSSRKVKPWPYDLKKSKELLAAAGWRDSDGDGYLDRNGKRFAFKIKIPSGSKSYERMCNLLVKSLETIGVKMEIAPFEWKVFVKFLDDRDYDAISLGWTGSLENDPFQVWHSSSMKNMGSNHVSFKNAEADTLMEKARSEFNADRRNGYYHRFHEILHEEQPYTFVSSGYNKQAVSKKFKCAGVAEGIKVHALGTWRNEWYVPKK